MVPEETVRHGHGPQDPSLMRERMIVRLAYAYLAHRMLGEGETPSDIADFETRMRGVYVYAHGGALIHRHVRGQTSLSWRNRTMVLPATREGKKLIGPAEGTMLARIKVQGKAKSTKPVALKIREAADRVCAVLVQDLAQDSVRRQVFFASLPSGKCLTAERLIAREDIAVERIEQGTLSVINDGYFGEWQELRGQRHIFSEGCEQVFSGYPTDSGEDDVINDLEHTRWVNVDDRCGLVFKGSGRAFYRNRHTFKVCRAIEDDLVLSLQDEPREFKTGEQIAELVSLWCPEQTHQQTADQELIMHETPEHT
ncbi:MAG: hypothetical protein KAU31_01770, partial [Spirochaetaceae bacterium]|nr:hypothetical protein [Spirochaetaceae bacterium]